MGSARFSYFLQPRAPSTGPRSPGPQRDPAADILDKWASLFWERGVLGYPHPPTSSLPPDGFGRFKLLLQPRRHLLDPRSPGAHAIRGGHTGQVGPAWAGSGASSATPPPTSSPLPTGSGRFNHFANDGSIYWTPFTGPNSIHGKIQDKWASLGWERSILGYPTTDELHRSRRVRPAFNPLRQRRLPSTGPPFTGPNSIHGKIPGQSGPALAGSAAILGYPTTDELGTSRRGWPLQPLHPRTAPSTGLRPPGPKWIRGQIQGQVGRPWAGSVGVLGYPHHR